MITTYPHPLPIYSFIVCYFAGNQIAEDRSIENKKPVRHNNSLFLFLFYLLKFVSELLLMKKRFQFYCNFEKILKKNYFFFLDFLGNKCVFSYFIENKNVFELYIYIYICLTISLQYIEIHLIIKHGFLYHFIILNILPL